MFERARFLDQLFRFLLDALTSKRSTGRRTPSRGFQSSRRCLYPSLATSLSPPSPSRDAFPRFLSTFPTPLQLSSSLPLPRKTPPRRKIASTVPTYRSPTPTSCTRLVLSVTFQSSVKSPPLTVDRFPSLSVLSSSKFSSPLPSCSRTSSSRRLPPTCLKSQSVSCSKPS